MSKVHVRQGHQVGQTEARKRVKVLEEDLKKFGVRLAWSGPAARIKGTGVSGSIQTSDSEVEVNLKLGLVARAAGVDAKRLEASLARRLAEALGGSD